MDDVMKRCCTAGCRAYPLKEFPAKNQHAAAIMLMILNNLDPEVAQFPQELVTYGGNGQVFSNWAQVSAVPWRSGNNLV
jgi:urocanate hydratase